MSRSKHPRKKTTHVAGGEVLELVKAAERLVEIEERLSVDGRAVASIEYNAAIARTKRQCERMRATLGVKR